jgi:uncharacterized surface protein with fasciclin (FAS1) repeats
MNMKKIHTTSAFRPFSKAILLLAIGTMGLFTACDSDDVGGNLYTFTGQTIGQYLRADPNQYSEFTRLLDTTGVMGLMNTAGIYTCFAPDNKAMLNFYQRLGKTSLSDFVSDTLKIIAYDHIINGFEVTSASFTEGRLSELSMSERYITVAYGDTGEFILNKTSKWSGSVILEKDIDVHNGVVHKLSEVLNPTRIGMAEVIHGDSVFSLFYEALVATGLVDSILKDKDETYDPLLYESLVTKTLDAGDWYYHEIPQSRKYGYTLLMESDETYHQNDIYSLKQLKDYAASVYNQVYPEDAEDSILTSRTNSLNRFIAYHIMEKQLSYTKFIDAYDTDHMVKTRDMYEYIETLCPNTLMEISKVRSSNETNLINRVSASDVIHIVKANSDNDASNGVYHEVDGLLTYNKRVHAMMSTKRLRFDSSSFFPELTNNNMRGRGITEPNLQFMLPRGYIDRITCSEQTVVGYLTPYKKYQNYEGDEIFLNAASGKLYDFTITTLPLPAGTYEVRFGYLTNGKRGVAQLYFDGVPAGVPLNLNNSADNVSIGWEEPGSNTADVDGFENDKTMHNRGFMKGPACYKVPLEGWTYGENARYSEAVLRRVLGTYVFKKAGYHTLTVKGLSPGEFMFDYLEFMPTSGLESEDIY